jgi:hypothetical protein
MVEYVFHKLAGHHTRVNTKTMDIEPVYYTFSVPSWLCGVLVLKGYLDVG